MLYCLSGAITGDPPKGVTITRELADGDILHTYAMRNPDVVAELLSAAHQMAEMIIADGSSSPELRRIAEAFLEQLGSDSFGEH